MSSDIAAARWTDQQHVDANNSNIGTGSSEHEPQFLDTATNAPKTGPYSEAGWFTCERRSTLPRREHLECRSPPNSSLPLSVSAQWHWLVVSLVVIVFSVSIASASEAADVVDHNAADGHYTHQWAVHIPGGQHVADQIAAAHGFVNMGKIIDDHYHFHHNHVQRRSIRPSDEHHGRLTGDRRVHWALQQRAKSRQKRDFMRQRPSRTSLAAEMRMPLNDPKWSQMWYLNRGNGLDMNVIPAWRDGITGKGVVVTILDDGLESDHPDLEQNYDPKASYDVNSHDDDPMPHYDMTDSNRHGTRCAGEVAATANNSLCAVGIAYGASVGGVRMLDGDVTDAVEARSLSLNPQHIDIYSASWGPDDDGKTVDGPGEMATRAFIEGVTKGRAGKGSIFVWASGNGGREHDNCNCDGYTNSIWTLSISSATEEGHVPWYSEKCSSTLATTYSSGGSGEKQIVTTDLHHTCTASHTGTSASAPLAAGIVALVLEANGNLTWRDLQHIVVRTSKPGNLKDPTWMKNGVGRRVSHSFGYGLMDAAAMVQLARNWKTVPEQQRCEINAPHLDTSIPPKSHKTLLLAVQHCKGVNFLEHVQAKITLTSQRRGDIEIYLLSPAGTRVTLLTSRTHDVSRSGFNQWPFMSVHTWGEAPHGSWLLEIRNEGRFMGHAALKGWSLIFYGTTQPIDHSDPVSVRLEPNSSLSADKYPIIGTGPPGNKNNRNKSPSGQKPLGSLVIATAAAGGGASGTRKPPKQFKQNGYGKNGNKGGQSRLTTSTSTTTTTTTTTQRPAFSLSNYNRYTPAEKTRMYNLSGYLASLKSPTTAAATTMRPPSRSQIANIVDAAYTTNNKHSLKAAKQVKPIQFAPSEAAMTTTAKPNIPKKFQNYEKVQEFYPEFQVFEARSSTQPPFADERTAGVGGGAGVYSRVGSFVQNGKPSRENAKNQFFKDHSQTNVGKKNSSQIVLVRSPDMRSHPNRTAQITQWEMIFHGTETPAQAGDPPTPERRGSISGQMGADGVTSYSSELDHNSLEFEASNSDQWRDVHKNDVSHVDVQRTTSNDQTSSACRRALSNTQCIECQLITSFLFEGRCYAACPERSYHTASMPDTPPGQPGATKQNLCGPCHFSCETCSGPNEYDCTTCPVEATFTERSSNESYCLSVALTTPAAPLSQSEGSSSAESALANGFNSAKHFIQNAFVTISIVKCVLIVAICVCVFELLRKFTNICDYLKCCKGEKIKSFSHAYDKVSTTDIEDDIPTTAVTIPTSSDA